MGATTLGDQQKYFPRYLTETYKFSKIPSYRKLYVYDEIISFFHLLSIWSLYANVIPNTFYAVNFALKKEEKEKSRSTRVPTRIACHLT